MIGYLWYIGISFAVCYYIVLILLEWQFRKRQHNTTSLEKDLPIVPLDTIDHDDIEDFRYNPIFKAQDQEEIDNEVSLRIIKSQKTI